MEVTEAERNNSAAAGGALVGFIFLAVACVAAFKYYRQRKAGHGDSAGSDAPSEAPATVTQVGSGDEINMDANPMRETV